jgi:hypothetical protein
MKVSVRGWMLVGGFAALAAVAIATGAPRLGAQEAAAPSPRPGQLTEASLGNLLQAMGLKVQKEESRYDFAFKAVHAGEEWELSMSAVLSQNGQSIWLMAWLDPLPRSATDVPRTALLRLLADNDRLGKGKFFAYVASNRRFVLQRVIANESMSSAAFRDDLQDLGASVVETYSHWSVANWKAAPTESETAPAASGSGGSNAPAPRQLPPQSAVNESKFTPSTRN